MRKKRARLEATAPLVHSRAAGTQEIDRALAAFHAERRARTEALGVPDPYASAAAQEFLARLAREGALELHTLAHGERIIAVFGALPGDERLSGLFIGHDGDPEIARSSPARSWSTRSSPTRSRAASPNSTSASARRATRTKRAKSSSRCSTPPSPSR